MNPDVWAMIGVFALTQIISLVVAITMLRSDARVLKDQILDMRVELRKLAEVVIAQALQAERIKQVEERQLLSGKRLDEMQSRFNHWADKITLETIDKAAHSV